MDAEKLIRIATVLLAFTAGYCDTTTFVAADQVFSAHVTGNFIVLAYDLVNHADADAWIKLLTFPVFVTAVIVGGWFARSSARTYDIIITEGILLIVAGICAIAVSQWEISGMTYIIVMMIVFAMGLQNAFGKLFAKETVGPTTMMTGNVTQIALDVSQLLRSRFTDLVSRASLKRQLVNISGFLIGCVAGGLIARSFGLATVILPGIIVIVFSFWRNTHTQIPN